MPALKRRSWKRRVFFLFVLVIAVPFILVAIQVDDWSRDLTTNVAETSPRAPDEELRPLVVAHSADAVVQAVQDAAEGLRGWRVTGVAAGQRTTVIHLERTSRIFRLTDDIRVQVDDRGVDRLVTAVSRSRAGRGDLGQNPRNLKELLTVVWDILQSRGPP